MQQLLLGKVEVAAHIGHVESGFELQHELADGEGLDDGDGGLVGAQYAGAEPLAQPAAQGEGGSLGKVLLAVLHIDIDEAAEGGIAKGEALVAEVVVEAGIVVVDDLTDEWQAGLARLQYNEAATTTTAGTSADLRHHHEGVLVGAEVGQVDHPVGVEDADDADAVEIEALANHLCADKQVGAAGAEVADDALVGLS